MCGIAGIVLRPSADPLYLASRLRLMADALLHRGPDDGGVYVAQTGCCGLANRRLAIRDCSSAGHMPMADAELKSWISYNGECYNAEVLRSELEDLGYRFRSNSDTEVLLYGQRAWGDQLPERLRGMFAFAIHDRHDAQDQIGRLLLARDRLGIKPLYYAETPHAFVFASELKTVLASGLVGRELDPAALAAYLMLGSIPAPLTIFKGIRALEAGHALEIDAALRRPPRVWRYWHLPTEPGPAMGAEEAEARVRSLLDTAVRSHLVSDVPLGAFLSGGLDSSSVVALMRAATSGPIRTCSMVFEEQGYSEGSYAQAVAAAAGTEHYERVLTGPEVLGELEQILWAMDQPTHDGINTYFVSQSARQAGLTVALSGLGGDELFGGYPNTFEGVPRTLRALRAARRVPAAEQLAGAAVATLPVQQRWAKVAAGVGRKPSLASAYLVQRGLFSPAETRALLGPELWAAAQSFNPVDHIAERTGEQAAEPFAWVSRAELTMYTNHQLLRDTDVMSMAHSLEVRVPLLDHELVEAVLGLPAELKRGAGAGPKPLLVRAMGELLPPLVRERRDKQGFTLPFERWLRGPLAPQLDEWAATSGDLLRPEAVRAARQRFEAGRLHWSRMWAIAALQGWSGRALER